MTAFRRVRRYYNRYKNNQVAVAISLIVVAIMVAIAFYALKNYLFTGSFGLVAVFSNVRQRISTFLQSVKAFAGSLFGMVIDAFSGFSGVIVSSALEGNIAAWIWLTGYIMLLAVLIMNYIQTGGRKLIR